jgi:hypothetical protein
MKTEQHRKFGGGNRHFDDHNSHAASTEAPSKLKGHDDLDMTHKHHALFAVIAPLFLWPSIADAACDVPTASSSEEDLLAFLECSIEDAARASAAQNAMAARLRDLYVVLDGEAETRLDANQKTWRAETEASCPSFSNDTVVGVADSACLEKRYTERSAFLDDILAGCHAGSCPVDKL